MIIVGLIVSALIATFVVTIARFERAEMERQLRQLSVNEVTSLHAFIVNVMAKRPEDGDNIGVTVFNNWFGSRNSDYPGKVWSAWGTQVTAHVKEMEPGRAPKQVQDDVDREAFDSKVPVARMAGGYFRYSLPIVLGVTEGAKAEVCHGCHDAMGLKNGDVIAVLSSSLSTDEAEARLSTVLLWLSLGGVVATIFTVVAVRMVLVRIIANPMGAMTGFMTVLADGNYAAEVPELERKDEIGDIARAVKVFRDGLIRAEELTNLQEQGQVIKDRRALVIDGILGQFNVEVAEMLETMAASATELEATSQAMSETAEKTSHRATTVAAAVEEMAVNMRTVAGAAEHLAGSVEVINQRVSDSVHMAGSAREKARNANLMVQGLSQAVRKIGDVVTLINDIAAQTNLLALNATIEAARAGEAGKGFAVVAGEVKTLANQTARATDEISIQIGAVQQETQGAVAAITDIGAIIEQINELSSAIAASVSEQDAQTAEIANNVSQVSQATDEVSSNVVGVNEAALETGHAASDVYDTAHTVAERAGTLRLQVDTFLTNIRSA
ncbi:methyl-accepting chemotaxis protein [Paramagnetospirillum kuznetsovii]|uniref:Methyl-accepting chemotaxis protein n=2 Tax=Paramagnetospirillum kuznetsovii TaxID=2053833 RepID=A0A364NTW5_9PROT|nr:methyl-accepting chemotaxis protein [Paramagnetospirillum kuznetsovii]